MRDLRNLLRALSKKVPVERFVETPIFRDLWRISCSSFVLFVPLMHSQLWFHKTGGFKIIDFLHFYMNTTEDAEVIAFLGAIKIEKTFKCQLQFRIQSNYENIILYTYIFLLVMLVVCYLSMLSVSSQFDCCTHPAYYSWLREWF